MSFNYLEVARAADLIAKELPDRVVGVELVRFPLGRGQSGGTIADINVALKLERARRMIVLSLKAPWTGLFFMPPNAFQPAGAKGRPAVWASAFNGCEGPAQDWNSYIQNQTLSRISVEPGDRVARLAFENGAELTVELFPSRPNWILRAGGAEFKWRESLARRAGAPAADLALREFTEAPGADWLERAYRHYLAERQAVVLKTRISRAASQLQTRLSKLIKIRAQMQGSLRESEGAERLRAQAEALKARLYELPQGHKARELDGIELDPRYTVADNVMRQFSRIKKLQRTKKEVEARLSGIEQESRRITSSIAQVRGFTGDAPAFLELCKGLGIELEEEAVEGKKPRKEDRKWSDLAQKGVRRFQSKDGLAIWVGRNHKENEELVIRLARGNDLWLHLKGKPGAHVVIQLPGGKSASLDTLLDAATLTAYYSGVSDKEKVEVDYTFRKYVKRVPGVGGEKFLVTYTQNKTIMLKMEDERLWRLLKQH